MKMESVDEVRRECERLAIAFAQAVDHRDVGAVLDVFTEDAIFERKGEQLRGHAAIAAAQRAKPEGTVTRHLCTTIKIDVLDPTHARGVVYFLLFRHDGDAAADAPVPLVMPQTLGEYHDDFVRTDDGWRIARRVARAVFRRAS